MKVIGGFSAPPNGFRFSHPSKMSSRQKQETPRYSLSGTTHINTNVENPLSDLDLQQAIELRKNPLSDLDLQQAIELRTRRGSIGDPGSLREIETGARPGFDPDGVAQTEGAGRPRFYATGR
jgi:hypothetical protein